MASESGYNSSNNVKYLAGGATYAVSPVDDIINCDTTLGVIILYLPHIQDSYPKRYYINDTGGQAGTNNIIVFGSNNTINGGLSFLFDTDFMSGECVVTGQTEWLINSDRPEMGTGTVTSFSFTNGSGFTGIVTNGSTTPTLSLVIADTRITGALLTGLTAGTNTPITATDTILSALANLQAEIDAVEAGDVDSVTGTVNRITASPTTGNVIVDISASYVGQTSITTLGTITTGATGVGFTIALSVSTITGVLGITNGGSGQTTANNALNAFLPSQVGNSGRFLTTDGTNSSWSAAAPTTGTGTANFGAKWTGTSTLGNSLYQDDGTNTSIGVTPVASQRFTVLSTGTTSATFIAKFHNSTGTNNSLILRSDGFNSMGSAVVTSTRLNIQSSGTTSATFVLKLDNSTPAAILYVRSDKKVAVATSTFISATRFVVDATGDSVAYEAINADTGYKFASATGSVGMDINLSRAGATGMSLITSGDSSNPLTLVGFNGTNLFQNTGVLTGNYVIASNSFLRDINTAGFDITQPLVLINDNTNGGSISGDVFSIQKGGVNVFRISTASRIIYTDGNQAASKVLTSDASGIATWQTLGASGAFVQNGNSFGVAARLGTNDNFNLEFETNNTLRWSIANTGNLLANSTAITGSTGYNGLVITANTGVITTGTWSATTILANRGGTGFASYAVGDILSADTTTTLSKIADIATGNALISGGVGVLPLWGKIALTTHVSGILPIANGGTNNSSQVSGGVTYFDATSIKSIATFTFDGTNLGIGATPKAILTASAQTTIIAPPAGTVVHFIGLDASFLRITLDTNNSAAAGGTAFLGRRSRGTAAAPLAVSSGDTIITLNGAGYGTTGFAAASTGLITIKANQAFTDSAMGTYITFFTTPNGSVTAAEALRVTGAGEINAFQAAGVFQINGTTVISATALGSGVLSSSLTSVGTITTGVWNGTIISAVYGGTGIANNVASTITISGSFATTFTVTAANNYTLPTATSKLLAHNLGIAGGTALIGDTAASGILTLSSTSNATKGSIILGVNAIFLETAGYMGLQTLTPNNPFSVGLLTVADALIVTAISTFFNFVKGLVVQGVSGQTAACIEAQDSTGAVAVSLFDNGNIKSGIVGGGLYLKEGTNATMGVATLVAGTVVVSTTKVTASSRILLTVQSLGTVAVATPIAVTARTAGTSFTITSSAITDTSVIAWCIVEPS